MGGGEGQQTILLISDSGKKMLHQVKMSAKNSAIQGLQNFDVILKAFAS